jgi:hypothetical protein
MEPTVKLTITPGSAMVEGGSINIFDMIQLTFSAIFNFANQTVDKAEGLNEFQVLQLKDEICDYINTACMNVVSMFHPDYQTGTEDIADEAIMELADEKLAEALTHLSDEDKEKARAFIEERKLEFKGRATQILSADDVLGKAIAPPPEQQVLDFQKAADARALSQKE